MGVTDRCKIPARGLKRLVRVTHSTRIELSGWCARWMFVRLRDRASSTQDAGEISDRRGLLSLVNSSRNVREANRWPPVVSSREPHCLSNPIPSSRTRSLNLPAVTRRHDHEAWLDRLGRLGRFTMRIDAGGAEPVASLMSMAFLIELGDMRSAGKGAAALTEEV
jgi:hypothetical protein